MEALFLKLVNMSITASWLVLAVLLLRLVFRKAPRWISCALWGLVALRLICPVSIESALSLIPSGEPLPREILYTASPEIHSGIAPIDNAVNPVLSQLLAPDIRASVNPTQVWSFIFSRAWLVGVGAMLLYALISYLLLKRRVDAATALRDNIKQSSQVGSPFVLGFFRPVIYLPYAVSEADQEYVIAHEQAHIKRCDHWWKPIGFLLLSVYWFNPVMWAAYALLCRDIEAACDERVIASMEKNDRQAYSTALLNCSVHRRRIAACPLAFGEVGVKGRVKGVMNYKKPAFWFVALAVTACLIFAICFLTNPRGLRLDFSENRIISAACFDMRNGEDKDLLKELNQAQIGELTSRLESLSGAKKSDQFAGLTPGYQISAKLTDEAYIRISGYALDHPNSVDIEWYGERYVVTDEEFQEYLSRICEGGDMAPAEEVVPGESAPGASGTVNWAFSPMMSATWHTAFHFSFNLDYTHIEASCDEGELWDFRTEGQPREKTLRFEAGSPVCWAPLVGDTLEDTSAQAQVNFTVYDDAQALYSGTFMLVRTAEGEHPPVAAYEARLTGCDELLLQQRDGNMGASVVPIETYEDMISPGTIFVQDNSVTEIGRGTLKSAVELSDEDAEKLLRIIEDGNWNTSGTTDCSSDCAINLGGRLIYYHSECGTFHEFDLAEMPALSHLEPSAGQSLSLFETEKTEVNEILAKYIVLGGLWEIAEPTLNLATLKDLVRREGENLTWADFASYYCEDVGSGLYILHYPIDADADCYLLIGGGSMGLPPMYIRLVSASDPDSFIDVRYESIDDFLTGGNQSKGEAGGETTEAPYTIRLSHTGCPIFDGPGYDYTYAGTIQAAGTYTIIEEELDYEGILWGKLKSGAGWIDIAEAKSKETNHKPITVGAAQEQLLRSGDYHEFIADDSEYMVKLVFRSGEDLKNVRFSSLQYEGDAYGIMEELYTLPELSPDMPLVAGVVYYGDMTAYGISFVDASGEERHFAVYMSARNGALILEEYQP